MPLNFPTSPAPNEIYTFGGRYWIWNGTAWDSYSPVTTITTLNGLTGTVGITAGSGMGVTVSGQNIVLNNTGVLSFNGLTGAVTGVTTGYANTFGPVQSFNGGIVASGATLTGNVYITGLGTPSVDSQAANKAYVDSVASVGIHYHTAVTLASTDSETFNTGVTYDNGASGVGATLRKTASFARINIDSTDGSTGDRILIRSAATQQWNGVYSVTNQGSGSTGWILTRTTDADNYHPYENDGLGGNDYFFVTGGSSLKNNAYICSNVGGITFGTTAITFSIFSTPPVYTAGTGLALNSLQFSNTGVLSFNGSTGAVTGVSSVRGLTGTVGISAGLGITLSTSGQTLTISNLVTNENTSISDHYLAFYGVTSGIANPKVDSELRYVPGSNTVIGYGGLILRGLSAGGVANQNTLVLNDPNTDGIVFYTADNNILVSNFSGGFGDTTSLSLVSWDLLDNPRTATIAPITAYTGNQTFTLPDDSGTIALTKNVVSSFNGLTGAVTGVRSIRGLTGAVGITNGSGIGLSVSGQTMTFSNTGVLSFNGLTGDVTGVTTGSANTFGPLQSFTNGISAAGGTFSSQARFLSGITVAGGATFATDISVNSIRVGKGAGNQLYNVALGNNSLTANTTGNYNLAIGTDSLASNLDGTDNVGIGYLTLSTNTSGIGNIAIGSGSLIYNTTGTQNIGIGAAALGANGDNNVAIGAFSLANLVTTVNRNQFTAIGSEAGRYRGTSTSGLQGGTGSIFIGYQSRASANAQTNEIVIGTQAVGLGSNTAVIGATAQTAATIYGLLNLPGGISAAGGMTLTGTMSLNGQTFTNLVGSVNGLTGSITLAAGSNITITPSGNTLTIASSGAVSSVEGLTGDVVLPAIDLYLFNLGIV